MFDIFKSSSKVVRNPMKVGRPFDVDTLVAAYYTNAYHSSCINLKTICILGDGPSSDEVNDLLKRSVRMDSVFTLLQKTILDLRIYGNAFWETVRLSGSEIEIYHLPAIGMDVDKKGRWVQRIGKEEVSYADDEIWHFREPSLLSSIWGAPDYLPLINDGTLETLSALKAYNKNFFRNNAIPDGILFIKGGDLGPATQSGLRSFFRQKYSGVENAAKFCVAPIPEGVEIQLERLQITTDGKFMELRDALVSEVVSCHGVPPRLAGIMVPGSLGGSGEAGGELDIFLTTRIKPLQNVFGGQLDKFFQEVLGMHTDVSFVPFEIPRNAAAEALSILRG